MRAPSRTAPSRSTTMPRMLPGAGGPALCWVGTLGPAETTRGWPARIARGKTEAGQFSGNGRARCSTGCADVLDFRSVPPSILERKDFPVQGTTGATEPLKRLDGSRGEGWLNGARRCNCLSSFQNLASKALKRRSSSHWAAAFSLESRKALQAGLGFSLPRGWALQGAAGM